MTNPARQILAIKVGNAAVLAELPNAEARDRLKQEAEGKGAACALISLEEYISTYRGYRYFDLRNPVTRESFNLDEVLEILAAPLDEHSDEDGNFILH